MRRDGDVLISHVARAKHRVVLCAPFIKLSILERLFSMISSNVHIDVITRWHPQEVAAGVSDLGIFELVTGRPNATLRLLDNLHAKLYFSDDLLLAGSANLTATALGWCKKPNLELLVPVPSDDPAVVGCLDNLSFARPATVEERDRVKGLMQGLPVFEAPVEESYDRTLASMWIPSLAAPEKLYFAYRLILRDRLAESVLQAAEYDLDALQIPPDLSEQGFQAEVSKKLSLMPSFIAILEAVSAELSDADGAALIDKISPDSEVSAERRWLLIRDWLIYFFKDKFELAPQSYITRPKSGGRRV